MTIGQLVVIGPNPTHPRLAGRVGTVVAVTPMQRTCGISHVTNQPGLKRARVRCGGNPLVLVGGEKYLVPRDAVSVVEAA